MSKRSKGQMGENKVIALIGQIKDSHYLLNDVTLINATSEMSHQIDHVLIHPNGLFVIETKNYSGTIAVDQGSGAWIKTIRGRSERIANPLRQNKSHAITLRKALKSKYKPIPVTVFVQNNAPYIPDENLINLQDLLLFIDSYPYQHRYNQIELDEIKVLIESSLSKVSLKEHLENIAVMRKVRKEQEAEMAYAIEKGLCPVCNSPIEESNYRYTCPRCGYSFKL